MIVTGGVSVGPHDHVKAALAALGVEEVFWRVALQPGKPTWFGRRGSVLVFGLPGNPVSAVVTFALFVRPALAAVQGRSEAPRLEPEAVLATAVRRNPDREQAVRVRLERRDGTLVATPNGPQGSHIVTSLLGADALALCPPATASWRPARLWRSSAFRADRIPPCPCSPRPWQRSPRSWLHGAGGEAG